MPQPWQASAAANTTTRATHSTSPEPAYVQRQVTLCRGDVVRLWLPAGGMVLAQAPRLEVRLPAQYLGEQLSMPCDMLEDGQVLGVSQACWVELRAADGGMALCMWPCPRPWLQRLRQIGQRLLGRTRIDVAAG